MFGPLSGRGHTALPCPATAIPGLEEIRIVNGTEKAERMLLSANMSLPNVTIGTGNSACALWSLQVDSDWGKFCEHGWFNMYGQKKNGETFGLPNPMYFDAYADALCGNTTLDHSDKRDLFAIFVALSWARGGATGAGTTVGSVIEARDMSGRGFTLPPCPPVAPSRLALAYKTLSMRNEAIRWIAGAGPDFQGLGPSPYFGPKAFPHIG